MAKHGLVLGDLQQFVDDPAKTARLVSYMKAGAPAWQPEILPDIDWAQVYETLGMSAEYLQFRSGVAVNTKPDIWTLLVVNGVTCNKVVRALKSRGVNMYLYVDDLNSAVPTNDRDPSNGSYVVSFCRNIEADEEFKNLSANDLVKQNHKGITLLERLLLELGYFLATGKHLDEKNWTLCSGSRCLGGGVPGVSFNSDSRGVDVDWDLLVHADDCLRSRSAV